MQVPNTSEQKANKLAFLDGFRGLACVYVVLYHFWFELSIAYSSILTQNIKSYFRFLNFGNCSVAAFIAISGYCLMLSTVRSSSDTLKNGWREFLIRRCRRILPGYYVCLLLGIVLMNGSDVLHKSLLFQNAIPVDMFSGVISHLLLIHNINQNWVFNINPPLWSVAVEWQIYFMYAFVMMPLYSRFKANSLLLSGAALSVVLFAISRLPIAFSNKFFWPHSWFVFIFALAAYAAWYNYRVAIKGMSDAARLMFVSAILAAFCLLSVLFFTRDDKWLEHHNYIVELLSGGISIGVMVLCIDAILGNKKSFLVGFLSLPFLVFLGKISYSIYLYHCFVMAVVIFLVMKYLGAGFLSVFATLSLALSLVVLLSYFSYKYVERPFMRV
ncbi:acyltransferase family protein [Armatimonas rosea]|uniref:Peptidoglycan/LPS O-acetylase OafA/YrhL n=1 Tax=Armatimonas rosea TaxID=685828 RepID=A0A7W9SWW9_ARMRO|nr:acyltransferase [Armatimonas rosea]MBB6053709.1 peptidoglycan/LPS O-acetylase OafA/YrhL [Armatimonas rosea]